MRSKKMMCGVLTLVTLAFAGFALSTSQPSVIRAEESEQVSQEQQAFPAELAGVWRYSSTAEDGTAMTVTITVDASGSFTTVFASPDGQTDTKSGSITTVAANGSGAYRFTGGEAKYFGFTDSDYSNAGEQAVTGFYLDSGVLYPQLWKADSEGIPDLSRPFSKVQEASTPGEITAFPTDLVGTWSGKYEGDTAFTMTIVIDDQGRVVKTKEDADGKQEQSSFTIAKVQLIGDNLYRLVDADGYFSEVDLAALGGKYEAGFSLVNGVLRPVYWHVADPTAEIDYSNPVYGAQYSKVSAEQSKTDAAASASDQKTSGSSSASAAAQTTEDKKKNGLPSTGEVMTGLVYVGAVLLVVAGLIFARKGRKEKDKKRP